MGLFPKAPKPVPPANPGVTPTASFTRSSDNGPGYSSLITSTPAGLQRKNNLNRVSLIGGG